MNKYLLEEKTKWYKTTPRTYEIVRESGYVELYDTTAGNYSLVDEWDEDWFNESSMERSKRSYEENLKREGERFFCSLGEKES